MSTVSELVTDPFYFPPFSPKQFERVDWSHGVSSAAVKQTVKNMLSVDFKFAEHKETDVTGVEVFDELSKILPFNDHTSFFWRTTVYPTASLLNSSGYSVADQATFLIFLYARILGLMGRADKPQSILTLDGSPIELSWVFPKKTVPNEGVPPRLLAFIMEPFHPETGLQLRVRDILDYLASPKGGLGVVNLKEGSMQWRDEIENFLFSHLPADSIEGSGARFYFGFYLLAGGSISIKTYLLLPNRTPAAPNMKVYRKERDYAPIKELIPRLDEVLLKPFKIITDYFSSIQHEEIPTLLSLVTDLVPAKDNHLKFYCHTANGLSLSHVERHLTLGGRLSSPGIQDGLEALGLLWNTLFPEANQSKTFDIAELLHNGPRELGTQHRVGGVLYFVEMKNGEQEPTTKVYIPIRNYLPTDTVIAQRLEAFCDKVGFKDPLARGVSGWFEKDFAKAFNHRPLDSMSGCCIHIGFSLRHNGWEVGHYYSPENWIFLEQRKNITK